MAEVSLEMLQVMVQRVLDEITAFIRKTAR
jgi:hypothetical protein